MSAHSCLDAFQYTIGFSLWQFQLRFAALEVELWQEKLENSIARRQQMYDYLVGALQLFPSGTGE